MSRRETGYDPGHPWHYVRGGRVEMPSEIITDVQLSGYRGYRADDIAAADCKLEPARSEELRALKADVLKVLRADLSRYREVARELHVYRRAQGAEDSTPACDSVHTSVSLKYCHLYNDFAHLLRLDELLSLQGDLFDL